MRARSFIGAVLILGALLAPRQARADAQSEADALITKGIDLREKGHDDEALSVFRQAFARAPSARARAQVGLAEQALGMWVVAETDVAAALATDGDPWIAKNKAALEGALAVIRKHVATLEVRGADKADVFVDGVKVGAGAGPFRVEAGRRSLEVRAKGFQPTTRSVELPPGGIARETVTLVALPPDTPSAPPQPAPTAPPAPARDREPGTSGQRILGWAFVGTGAALLATGGVSFLFRKGIIDDYNTTCPGVGAATQPPQCEDQIDSSRTWFTIGIITLVGGGVFAAGGAALVVTAPSSPKPSAAIRFGCAPEASLSGGTVTCKGTF